MKKGIKTVSAVLVLSLMTGTLSGCDNIFAGKKKESQEEAVRNYISACMEFRYDDSMDCVSGDDAFQDVAIEVPRYDLVAACLSCATIEIVSNEDDQISVEITAPDVDKTIRNGDPGDYDIDHLKSMVTGSEYTEENTFEFDMVKVDRNWLIDEDSTEDLAKYISEIGLETESVVKLGTNACSLVDGFLGQLGVGDVDAAMNLTTNSAYAANSNFMSADDNADTYVLLFSGYEFETELDCVDDQSATVTVTGTRPSIAQGMEIVSDDPDVMIPYIKTMLTLYADSGILLLFTGDFSTAGGTGYDFYNFYDDLMAGINQVTAAAAEVAPSEEFSVSVDVVLNSNGVPKIDEYDTDYFFEGTETPVIREDFYDQALDELLDEGVITQEEYDLLYESGPEGLMTF